MRMILHCTLLVLLIGIIDLSECRSPSLCNLQPIIARYCARETSESNPSEVPDETEDPTKPVTCLNNDGPENEEERVVEAFQKFGFIPTIIPRPPTAYFVSYLSSTQIGLGNHITAFKIGFRPRISFESKPGSLTTLILLNVDGNYVRTRSYEYTIVSLLIVNIPENDETLGDEVVSYQPMLPIPGFGDQRYLGLLYEQEEKIDVTLPLKTRIIANSTYFNLKRFTRRFNLNDPFAGNFFRTSLEFCNYTQSSYSQ